MTEENQEYRYLTCKHGHVYKVKIGKKNSGCNVCLSLTVKTKSKKSYSLTCKYGHVYNVSIGKKNFGCNVCNLKRHKLWRDSNREKYNESQKIKREKHGDKIKKHIKQWKKNNLMVANLNIKKAEADALPESLKELYILNLTLKRELWKLKKPQQQSTNSAIS